MAKSPDPLKRNFIHIAEVSKVAPEVGPWKRVYYIANFSDEADPRAGHYHGNGKHEIMICQEGLIEIEAKWNGGSGQLSLAPGEFCVIASMVWHRVIVGPKSLLLVLSPVEYEPGESKEDQGFLDRQW